MQYPGVSAPFSLSITPEYKMQQVKFGSEKYEAIFKAGFAVGVAYNNFNAAVSAALECVRKCQGTPSHAEINHARAMFEDAFMLDQAFMELIEDIEFVGGNDDFLLSALNIMRKRDHEIKALLDKHYPVRVALH
jgi:hypothetical protein